MRRTAVLATVAAAALAGTAAVALAGPVLAAGSPWSGRGNGTAAACPMGGYDTSDDAPDGARNGAGSANGYGPGGAMTGGRMMGGYGMGRGMAGAGDPAANLPASGTLTDAQKSALAGMAEEEKLAHDVYTALAVSSGDARFTRIAASEQRHLDAVRVLLTRYGITDPTAGKTDGQFTSAAVAQLYADLVVKGKASSEAALGVGRTIETMDIADLAKAGSGVSAADVTTVYQRLSAASQMHLRAFGG